MNRSKKISEGVGVAQVRQLFVAGSPVRLVIDAIN